MLISEVLDNLNKVRASKYTIDESFISSTYYPAAVLIGNREQELILVGSVNQLLQSDGVFIVKNNVGKSTIRDKWIGIGLMSEGRFEALWNVYDTTLLIVEKEKEHNPLIQMIIKSFANSYGTRNFNKHISLLINDYLQADESNKIFCQRAPMFSLMTRLAGYKLL